MNITWEVDDGYVGGSAPQHSHVSDLEITECSSVDEAMEMIEDCIRTDFEQKITCTCDMVQVRKEVEKLFAEKDREREAKQE